MIYFRLSIFYSFFVLIIVVVERIVFMLDWLNELKNEKDFSFWFLLCLHLAFIALLDNYERDTGCGEIVTNEEIRENCAFIDCIMETEPMKIAHEYLAKKKLMPKNVQTFKQALYELWFKMYRRTKGVRFVCLSRMLLEICLGTKVQKPV